MPTCLIGLGANLDNRREMLRRAVELLQQHEQLCLLRTSRWHETRPAGGPVDQPAYLNGAVTIETTLPPLDLLALLHDVEDRLGRRRGQRWEARPIDLDLLLHGDQVEQSAALVVPHPRMAWRRFVLEPACEIAPAMVHPVLRHRLQWLLDHLNSSPRYVAVTGLVAAENTRFAARIAETGSADLLPDTDETVMEPLQLPADSSGHAFSIAVKCLRRRARLLAAEQPRWSGLRRYWISDFWFDEPRAWAGELLAARQQAGFHRLWERLAPCVARPRLVVLLNLPAAQAWRQLRGPEESIKHGLATALLKRQQRALEQQLRRSDVGPVLRIADPDSAEAIKEVTAAIQAMD